MKARVAPGGIVVYYDLALYEFGQGEVVAQLQVRPFGPEVFLIFALCHVGAVFHDKLCVVLLHTLAPVDFVVYGRPTTADHFGDLRRFGPGPKCALYFQPFFPLNVLPLLSSMQFHSLSL